jgi:hypothetical protein
MKRHPLSAAVLFLCAASFAAADVVTLKDGRVLEGKVLEDDGKVLKIKLKKGNMTLDHKDIASIVQKPTAEEEYKARMAKLDVNSGPAQLEIGKWASSRELPDEAVHHLIAAYKIDPRLEGIAEEMAKLDYHLLDGNWCDADTYYPSIGYIKFEGHWCSPAEHAYRLALKEVTVKANARDAAKSALAGSGSKIRKIELRMAAEQATIDKITKAIAKADTDQAAALERFNAAEAKVKAASDKLVALQEKEKPKEGDPPKDPSMALKTAEKNVATARAAAEKESKALTAAKKTFSEQSAEKSVAEGRLKDIAKEKSDAEAEQAALDGGIKQAQAEVDEATATAEGLKAKWEKSKEAPK